MTQGYVHVYTGDGKGKTTAAIGLAVRAAGAGLRVFIAQFMKRGDYGEIEGLRPLADRITVEQFGTGRFVRGTPDAEDLSAARAGLDRVRTVFAAGAHDLVILDEANVAAAVGVVPTAELLALLDLRPAATEVVLTGRAAPAEILARADLVTEMRAVRHYFQAGVPARKGIEK
jgi:cob(I)alamin adenosyltransferase